MARFSAARFFSCSCLISVSSSLWNLWQIWSIDGLELAVEPDVWLTSVLQAVGTRVSYVFSEDFAFGLSGFQAGQVIPDVFDALSLFWFLVFGGCF